MSRKSTPAPGAWTQQSVRTARHDGDEHSPEAHHEPDLEAKRRFGPAVNNVKARPFGYYPTASHIAGGLAGKDGRSSRRDEGKVQQASLFPLSEAEKLAGVSKIDPLPKQRTIEELKRETGTLDGWVELRSNDTARRASEALQPRYGEKFKSFIVTSERNQAHRHMAGHKRDYVEEDQIYRISNALRFDHDRELFVDCNLAHEDLRVEGVGIQWDAFLLRSHTLASSNIVQLRVKSLDPEGPAYSSNRVHIGDRLVSIDGEDVCGQTTALQMAKISGPAGTYVVIGLQGSRTLSDWLHAAREPCIRLVRLVRGGDPLVTTKVGADHRRKYGREWPDPNVYQSAGFCGMWKTNVVRFCAIALIENKIYKSFNLACVLLATACIKLEDPLDDEILNPDYPDRRDMLRHLSVAFSLVFIIEIMLQILAKGFMLGRKSFLQGGVLNVLDFLLAAVSAFDLFYYAALTTHETSDVLGNEPNTNKETKDESTGGSFRALRVVRAVRALRAVASLSELKTFVVCLSMSSERILDAAALVIFAITVTAIAGVQLFRGVLRMRCFSHQTGEIVSEAICGVDEDNCPPGSLCLSAGQNPTSASADNLLSGIVLVTSSVTMVGWAKQMFAYMRAAGRPAAVYFIFQVLVLAIYFTNVFLAIVVNQLELLKQSHVLQMTRWGVGHWIHRGSGEMAHSFNTWRHWTQLKDTTIKAHFRHKFQARGFARCHHLFRIVLGKIRHGPAALALGHWAFLVEDLSLKSRIPRGTQAWHDYMEMRRSRERAQALEELQKMHEELEERQRRLGMYYYEVAEYTGSKYLPYWDVTVHKHIPVTLVIGLIKSIRMTADMFWYLVDQWGILARGSWLERATMIVVVINTISMAMEHTRDSTIGLMWGAVCDPIKTPWKDCEEYGGDGRYLFFTMCIQLVYLGCIGFFALEMFIKIVGLGARNYFMNPMNLFDSMLVIISLVELPLIIIYSLCLLDESRNGTDGQMAAACDEGGSGLTVLRALRLVRLLRLLRNVPNIRRQLAVLAKTFYSLFALGLLLIVFVIIAGSIGSYVYGGRMTEAPSRLNLYLGALVWISGENIPQEVVDNYQGYPARVSVINVSNNKQMPLGVEILTTFGEARRVRARQWARLSYLENGNDFTRRRQPHAHFASDVNMESDGVQDEGQVFEYNLRKTTDSTEVHWKMANDFEADAKAFVKNGQIVAVLPRSNFADPVTGWLAVLQIMLLEGWTDIFEKGVQVAGLWPNVFFFFSTVLFGRFLIGSLAISTVIIGYNQEQFLQHKIIRAEAVREHRVKMLKQEFKEKVIRERLMAARGKNVLSPAESEVQMAESKMKDRHLRFQAVQKMLFQTMQDLIKSGGLKKSTEVDRFMDSSMKKLKAKVLKDEMQVESDIKAEASAKRSLKRSLGRKRNQNPDESKAGQNEDELAAMKAVEHMMNIDSVKSALEKMSDIDQEMYLRQGLDVVQLGQHVAYNLESVVKVFQSRLQKLREAAEVDKGNAGYYRQQMIPLRVKEQEMKAKIAGLRFGFQTGKSLFIFPPLHPVRVFCCRLAFNRRTHWFVMILIFFSCFCVALDRPGLSMANKRALDAVGSVTNLLFFAEFVLKAVGLSFEVYFSSSHFNKLDFFIVLTSLADEIMKFLAIEDNVAMLQGLRVVRSFRILRLLSRIEGLAFVLRTIATAVRPLIASSVVSLGVCVLFGLLGLQLLMGKLHYCTDPLIHLERECQGPDATTGQQRAWLNTYSNFDWIGRAVATVYTVSTGAGWNKIMFSSIDASEIGAGPIRNTWPSLGLFFVVIILIGRYLMLTLFTAIFVDAFEKANIRVQILKAEKGKGEMWKSGEMGMRPTRQQLPPVDSMFDEGKVEERAMQAKALSLWTALHQSRLGVSDIAAATSGSHDVRHKIGQVLGSLREEVGETFGRLSSTDRFRRLSSGGEQTTSVGTPREGSSSEASARFGRLGQHFARVSSAASVARHTMQKRPTDKIRQYPGIDYLGQMWLYTAKMGAWRERNFYHRQTVVMLCSLDDAQSKPPDAAMGFQRNTSARSSAAGGWDAVSAGGGFHRAGSAKSGDDFFNRVSSVKSVTFGRVESFETTATEDVPALLDEIEEFLLLPGAQVELIHAWEFEALESIGVPSSSIFVIRISLALPDLSAQRTTTENRTMAAFRSLTRAEDAQNSTSGLEFYLCPETDKGTEKMFQYLMKLSKAAADAIPLPTDLGLKVTQKKSKQSKNKMRRTLSSASAASSASVDEIARNPSGNLAEVGRTNSSNASDIGRSASVTFSIPEVDITPEADKAQPSSNESDSSGTEQEEDEQVKILHEGMIQKRGRIDTSYRSRYAVITSDGMIKYYKDQQAFLNRAPFQGSMAFKGASIEEDTGFHKKAGFMFAVIDSFGRRLDMSVEKEQDRRSWLKAITRASRVKHTTSDDGESVAVSFVEEVVCSGWVYKRGDWRNPRFQKRWMVLTTDGWLKYYKSESDAGKPGAHHASQGSIYCEKLVIEEDSGMSISGTLYCFSLRVTFGTSKRKMLCACDTDLERTTWVTNLKQVRDTMYHVHQDVREPEPDFNAAEQGELNELLYGEKSDQGSVAGSKASRGVQRNTVEAQVEAAEAELASLRRFRGSLAMRFKMALTELEDSQAFTIFITMLILTNVAFMAVECYQPSKQQQVVIEVSNVVFALAFGAECIVRMLVHTPRRFFSSLWFMFDYFSCTVSIFVVGIEETGLDRAGVNVNPTLLRMFRLVKVIKSLRSLRLLKFLKGVNTILQSLAMSFGVVSNLATLYFILLFFFGVIGIVLLGTMCTDQDRALPGLRATRCLLASDEVVLEQYSSFKTMEMAFLTLIRLTTGDGWSDLMNKASQKQHNFPRAPNHLDQAAAALRRWNATDPVKRQLKESFLLEARSWLPGCASDEELNHLRQERLVDCSALADEPFETPCRDTCGSIFSLLVIPSFIFLSQGVILNLIVAVLIVNLRKLGRRIGHTGKARITKNVTFDKLGRIYVTWMVAPLLTFDADFAITAVITSACTDLYVTAASIRKRRHNAVDQRHRMRVLARWLHQGLARVLDSWKDIVREHALLRRACLRFLLLGQPMLITGIHQESFSPQSPISPYASDRKHQHQMAESDAVNAPFLLGLFKKRKGHRPSNHASSSRSPESQARPGEKPYITRRHRLKLLKRVNQIFLDAEIEFLQLALSAWRVLVTGHVGNYATHSIEDAKSEERNRSQSSSPVAGISPYSSRRMTSPPLLFDTTTTTSEAGRMQQDELLAMAQAMGANVLSSQKSSPSLPADGGDKIEQPESLDDFAGPTGGEDAFQGHKEQDNQEEAREADALVDVHNLVAMTSGSSALFQLAHRVNITQPSTMSDSPREDTTESVSSASTDTLKGAPTTTNQDKASHRYSAGVSDVASNTSKPPAVAQATAMLGFAARLSSSSSTSQNDATVLRKRANRGRHAAILDAALEAKKKEEAAAAAREREEDLLRRGALKMMALSPAQRRVALIRSIQRHPNNIVLWHMLAAFLQQRREYEAAALAFQNALKLNPNHIPSLDAYAELQREIGKEDESEALQERARQARAIVALADAHEVSSRQEAEALLDAAGFTAASVANARRSRRNASTQALRAGKAGSRVQNRVEVDQGAVRPAVSATGDVKWRCEHEGCSFTSSDFNDVLLHERSFHHVPLVPQQAAGRDDGQGPGQVGDEGGRGRRGCTGGQVPGMSEAAKKQQQDLVDLAKLMGANVI